MSGFQDLALIPLNPTVGTLAIDSNDNNTLKWWSGSVWVTAGG